MKIIVPHLQFFLYVQLEKIKKQIKVKAFKILWFSLSIAFVIDGCSKLPNAQGLLI